MIFQSLRHNTRALRQRLGRAAALLLAVALLALGSVSPAAAGGSASGGKPRPSPTPTATPAPGSGIWSLTSHMTIYRSDYTATRLADGRVLVYPSVAVAMSA